MSPANRDPMGDEPAPGWPVAVAARAVAEAVLYEGYLLYPYRRSSMKNRVRWQFGVLAPPAWARAHGLDDAGVAGSAESWWQRTECLLSSDRPADAELRLCVRFLQLQRKDVEALHADGTYHRVDRLTLDSGQPVLSFDEAVPREFDLQVRLDEVTDRHQGFDIRIPGGKDFEPLSGAGGTPAGRVVRRRRAINGRVRLSVPDREPAFRLRIDVENTDSSIHIDAARDEALAASLVACHTLLAVRNGSFLSLLEPPAWAEEPARACRNVHTFPVLAGESGAQDVVLSSPILLYDHPRVAPESPGDLHDATEIDEILALRTLTLTEAEKQEARATDARAAAIVDRTDAMPKEVFGRLHGAIRSLEPAGARASIPWWDPGADASLSPRTDGVEVDGTLVARGSRVRLRPRLRGTDPQDMFLDGRIAVVEAVLLDVDGDRHLAVTLEDDPAAELNQWYGRYRYFAPDEVEALPAGHENGENA